MLGEYPPQSALDMLMAEHDAERVIVLTPLPRRSMGVPIAELEDLFRDEEG